MFRIYSGDELIYEPGVQELALFRPKLTLEMGKAGSLEFTSVPGHPFNEHFHQISTPIQVTDDDEEIFRGRVLSGKRNFYNQREVYCEGDLSYLVDSVQKAKKFSGTVRELFNKIVNEHNKRMPEEKQFEPGTISSSISSRRVELTGSDEDDPTTSSSYDYKQIAINSIVDDWNTSYDYLETCLISYCGGYLMTRREGNTTWLDWFEDYREPENQVIPEIVFGENMLDFNDELDADDLFTVLIPLGDENLTIKNASGSVPAGITKSGDELIDDEAVEKYGRIIRTHVFSNVTSRSTLLANGCEYMKTQMKTPQTITITAIDMHLVNQNAKPIRLGDRVRILSEPHKMDGVLMTCSKIEYDLEKPENTKFTFGREKQTLTEQYRKNKREQSDTYGNSGVGSYGSYASAAGETLQKAVDKVYEEWVDIDPDNPDGIGSIGALYRYYKEDRQKIENRVGIDFDAEEGTATLYAKVSGTEDVVSAITAWAGMNEYGEIQTGVGINADVLEVKQKLRAVEVIAQKIQADLAQVTYGVAGQWFYGPHYYVYTGSDATEFDLSTHFHEFDIDNNGNVVLGTPTKDQSKASFNIASTQFYKDGVKAVNIKSFSEYAWSGDPAKSADITTANCITWSSVANMLFGKARLILSNDNAPSEWTGKYFNVSVGIDATQAVNSVDFINDRIDGVNISAQEEPNKYVYINNKSYTSYGTTTIDGTSTPVLYSRLYVPLTNGKSRLISIRTNATRAYEAGTDAATVSVRQKSGDAKKIEILAGDNVVETLTISLSNDLWGSGKGYDYDATVRDSSGTRVGYRESSTGTGAYSAGRESAITKIYINMVANDRVSVRAYHGDTYEYKWLTAGDTWDGFN